jgi:hypothetical protein
VDSKDVIDMPFSKTIHAHYSRNKFLHMNERDK